MYCHLPLPGNHKQHVRLPSCQVAKLLVHAVWEKEYGLFCAKLPSVLGFRMYFLGVGIFTTSFVICLCQFSEKNRRWSQIDYSLHRGEVRAFLSFVKVTRRSQNKNQPLLKGTRTQDAENVSLFSLFSLFCFIPARLQMFRPETKGMDSTG